MCIMANTALEMTNGSPGPLRPWTIDLIYVIYVHGSALSCTWWRHQMETFSELLAICAGNSPVPGEFPGQRPVTRSFDVFFDLRLNKRLSKQPWGWWFETLSRPFWRHHMISLKIRNFETITNRLNLIYYRHKAISRSLYIIHIYACNIDICRHDIYIPYVIFGHY